MSKEREKKIQDPDGWYSFLFNYVRFSVNHSYRKIHYVGLENIPQDGAIIFAPNHTNTLMDALVVLCYDHTPKVFVARADIFKNPWQWALVATLLVMPAPFVAHEMWKTFRLVVSDIKLLQSKKLMKIYKEIRKLMA